MFCEYGEIQFAYFLRVTYTAMHNYSFNPLSPGTERREIAPERYFWLKVSESEKSDNLSIDAPQGGILVCALRPLSLTAFTNLSMFSFPNSSSRTLILLLFYQGLIRP
jgi:hypothetical protein